MWRSVAATFLVAWLAAGGVQAGGADSTPDPGAPFNLVSPYQSYDLKLRAFQPTPSRYAGFLLPVRINGGRPLRLVLDSGADYIVIGSKAGRALGLAAASELDLVGLGSRPASVGWAKTVEVGPVSFRNCRVAFVEGQVLEGADGVLPLSLFSQFLLRLDLPEQTLGLIPYPPEGNPAVPPARSTAKHNLLLVAAVLNGKRDGYVAVDTGAFCSAISTEVARTLRSSQIVPGVALATGTGAATGQRVSSPVHFAIAGQDLTSDEVVALDLSNLSHHYGVEVMGVLGFPALSTYVLTIDYRRGQVKIEPPPSVSAREPHRGHNPNPPAPLAFR